MAQDRILSITGNVIYSLKISWQLNTEKVLEMCVYSPSNNLMGGSWHKTFEFPSNGSGKQCRGSEVYKYLA